LEWSPGNIEETCFKYASSTLGGIVCDDLFQNLELHMYTAIIRYTKYVAMYFNYTITV